nr:P-loop NTPase [Deltaproteobacteria bacterium]
MDIQTPSVKQERLRTQNKTPGLRIKSEGRVVTFLGSKGGIGTSTIAVNLADCLVNCQTGRGVALVDMNVEDADVPRFLGIHIDHHWDAIARKPGRVETVDLLDIMHKHDGRMYVLASPDRSGQLALDPELIKRVFQLLRQMFPFVVADSGLSLGGVADPVLEFSDQVFIVTMLSYPCLARTEKVLNFFARQGYPAREKIKIIINRHVNNSTITIREAERLLQQEVFWTFPNSFTATMAALNQGKTLSLVAPRSPMAVSIKSLAALLTAEASHVTD